MMVKQLPISKYIRALVYPPIILFPLYNPPPAERRNTKNVDILVQY